MRTFLTLGLAVFGIVSTGPALADQHHGRGHGGYERDGRGWDDDRYNGRGCPPGLAKKGCVPPGQARHYYYSRGQALPRSYGGWTRYDALPPRFRTRYVSTYGPRYRYIYRDDVVYVVDPTTRLIRDVVDLLTY